MGIVTQFSERTRVSLPAAVLVSLGVALVSATAGAFRARDQVLRDVESAMQRSVAAEASLRQGEMRHYVTREEWLHWRRSEGERRDRQYYSLLGEIRAHKGR